MSGMVRVVLVCLLAGGCALLGPTEISTDPPPAPPSETAEDETATPQDAPATSMLPATTVASLGNVTHPGLWMRTPLVTSPMRGRVSDPRTGRAVVLDLIPLDAEPGAGSRMSLAAYQQLNLPLTALPELRVEPAG
ncbi:hypothetical protein [Roseovarius nitratireducens]|uniref:hypothetical protein n=1 Tax=Roseovarius nitratireducens TaxID=2044597 RepID=UPI00101ADE4F|nr:hypothetical protein [Roseovarius nitratireducens]